MPSSETSENQNLVVSWRMKTHRILNVGAGVDHVDRHPFTSFGGVSEAGEVLGAHRAGGLGDDVEFYGGRHLEADVGRVPDARQRRLGPTLAK